MDRELLYRYFDNRTTPEEEARIQSWAEASPDNYREYLEERRLWCALLLHAEPGRRTRIPFLRRPAIRRIGFAAACILLLAGAASLFFGSRMLLDDRMQQVIVPAGQRVELVLADGTKVWLNSRSRFEYPASFGWGSRRVTLCGEGYFEGTVRYYSKEVDEVIDPIIERICRGVADAYRAKVEFKFNKILGPTINEPKTTEVCAEAAKKAIGEDCLYDFPPVTGGEDFSFIADKVPSAFAFVGVRNEACDAVYPHHSDKFKVDEDAIINSVALYVQVAMDLNAE